MYCCPPPPKRCRPDQIKQELKTFLRMMGEVYGTFGLAYKMALSTRPEKRLGDEKLWDMAEGALKEALDETGEQWEVSTVASAPLLQCSCTALPASVPVMPASGFD